MDHSNHQQNQKVGVRQLVVMSLLAGVSYILMFIAVPIIPIVPYMKIDFGDLPILLGTVLFGPVSGVVIAIIKCVLYWATTGASIPNLIGVGSSFISSASLIYAYEFGARHFHLKGKFKNRIMIVMLMTIALTILMSALDWIIVIPLYMDLIGLRLQFSLATVILIGVVPFNIIKGIVVGTGFMLIRDRVLKRVSLND